MKVNTITYKRVKNLGNYQTEALEMSAEIEAYEDPIKAADDLRHKVNAVLYAATVVYPASEDVTVENDF